VATMLMVMVTLFAMAGRPQAPTSQFSPAGIDDPKLVDAFLEDFQKAVAADDAARVAEMGRYPAEVVINKRRRRVKSREEMQKLYAEIFTPCLKRVIAATRPEDLFANYQGVMLGGGAVWFGLQGSRRVLFYTINGPVENEPLCSATPQ
jgi:hypothetical protein